MKIAVSVAALLAASPALAQSTRATMNNYNNQYIIQNARGAISGPIANTLYGEIINSAAVLDDTNSFTGTNNFAIAPALPLTGLLYGNGANSPVTAATLSSGVIAALAAGANEPNGFLIYGTSVPTGILYANGSGNTPTGVVPGAGVLSALQQATNTASGLAALDASANLFLPSALSTAGDLSVISNPTINTQNHYVYCTAPGTCNGVFAGTATDVRAYSMIYDELVIDSVTSKTYQYGENGLWVNFNIVTGYSPPPFVGQADRAGLQVSAFAQAGGGNSWAQADSITFYPGWQGVSGNFGLALELDPSNNATASSDIYNGGNTTIFGEWIAGPIGSYPITAYEQVSPVSLNGTNYGGHYGIVFFGSYLTDQATIFDFSDSGGGHNVASYYDKGEHDFGALYAGQYIGAAISISPLGGSGLTNIGISISPDYSICFDGAVQCVSWSTANTSFAWSASQQLFNSQIVITDAVFTGAPTPAAAGQISEGNTVVASSLCGSISGAAGCRSFYIASVLHYEPYW